MMGIQAMLTATKKMTKVLPTMSSSVSEGLALILVQMSMVKMVEDELKIEVREDIKAAIITASIRPRAPVIVMQMLVKVYSFTLYCHLIVYPKSHQVIKSTSKIFGY